MRSIYAAGVLDAFLDAEFDPFDLCFGVSAGALNLTSYLAGRPGRNYRILTRLARQPEFIRLHHLLRPGANVLDLDWMWHAVQEHEPLDAACAMPAPVAERLRVACTRVRDGATLWFQPCEHSWQTLARATCALPMLYRDRVEYDGEHWMDGAVSDPVPVESVAASGARCIVVIRTRPREYRKHDSWNHRIARAALRDQPAIRARMAQLPARYNRSVTFMHDPPAGLEVLQVAPSRPLRTGRTTRRLRALEADYQLGRNDARQFLARHRLQIEQSTGRWHGAA